MPRDPSPAEVHADVIEIVNLVAKGWTDQRIAQHLGLSVSTVRRRIRAAGEALGAHSRVQLAVAASERGLLTQAEAKRSE